MGNLYSPRIDSPGPGIYRKNSLLFCFCVVASQGINLYRRKLHHRVETVLFADLVKQTNTEEQILVI